MAEFLCEELIDEILGKLPPRSLLRFRTLSKSWCSRISSPSFIRKHALQSTMKPSQEVLVRQRIHYKYEDMAFLYRLHPEDEYMRIESAKFPVSNCLIVGSCNGIIFLYKIYDQYATTLWNPSIRRKLTIPSHPSGDYTLAYGFGFDPLADDYKIVSISFGGVQTSFLYSMKANVWSNIGPPSTSFDIVKSYACFVNGTLHWVVKSKSSDTGHSYILTFDLSTHVFGMISLPKPTWITNELTIIKGYLAVISSESESCDTWVWLRREYNHVPSWCEAFNLTNPLSQRVHSVFQVNNYIEDFESYNRETGIRSTLELSYLDYSYKLDMDMCVESLELLNNEVC